MPQADSSAVPLGTILEGKFRLTQEIGRGGMASVYEAENIDIGKRVAVKILSAELITSRIVRERFIREARAAAAIVSPYICEVYDSGMYSDRPFLVMELLQGESLYDRMTRVRQMKATTTVKILRHVVKGLAKAHEAGVVHRDLKPENIFLTRDADGQLLAKIVDFGLAKFYENRSGEEERNVRLTREGALFGTPAYMSPEQARGQGEVDHRADLWALGCIVYECLTGRTVWDVHQGVAMILAQIARGQLPNPRDYRPDLPLAFDDWFRRALHPDLGARYQTGTEFLDALENALASTASSPNSSLNPSAFTYEPAPPSSQPVELASERPNAALPLSAPPVPVEAHTARGIAWLFIAAISLLSGYGLWLFVVHPDPLENPFSNAASKAPGADPAPPGALPLAEKGPGADAISNAQELLRRDQAPEALKRLRDAKGENPNVAGSLLAHAEVGFDPTGPCQLTAIGRPRPFDVSAHASHARIALGPNGVFVAWTDAHQDARHRNVFASLLDDSLRRVGPLRNLTPEASAAIYPQILARKDDFSIVYWDAGNTQPGVYARALEFDGRLKTPARLVSSEKKEKYFPAVAQRTDGGLVAVWSEQRPGSKLQDLVLRRLNAELNPEGPQIYLTGLVSGDATQPSAEIVNGTLYVVYRLKTTQSATEVRLLRLPLDDPALSADVPLGKEDRTHGEEVRLRTEPRQADPMLACSERGCLLVWDDEVKGAFAAFVPHRETAPLWHREFSSTAKRVAVAQSPRGELALAYFTADRLMLVQGGDQGIGRPSVLSRVSGFQPSPQIIAGAREGQWLVAWRDFEAGHFEIFVAEARCERYVH